MLLSIEPDGPVPIYQQIRDRIVEAAAQGMAADDIVRHCQAAMAEFAFPAAEEGSRREGQL